MPVTFREVVAQVIDWLQQDHRISYRALKRQFGLDEEYLADLKDELINVRQVAVDQDATMLVWVGESHTASAPPSAPSPLAQTALTQLGSAHTESSPELLPPDAERRQLTVMFCDLVGSTPLSGQLDPEDLREVVGAYQRGCSEVIQRFDGHVRQFLGDALLVYFGWPRAHEDDAQRAVRAGLEMLDAMSRLNTGLEKAKGIRLAIRVGIHTGLVVVGEMGAGHHHEHLALGNTPNVASRIQDRADPDTVVISEATFRLVHTYFTVDALGAQSLKGVSGSMQLYRVVGRSADASKSGIGVAGKRGLTSLVGRQSEMALLIDRWVQCRDGRGQVVVLSGEAGIGKSRLVAALHEHVADEGASSIVLRCSPYHANTALHPVIEYLRQMIDLADDDTDEVRLTKLEHALETSRQPLQDVVPLLTTMLGWPHPRSYPALDLSGQRQRQKTRQVLVTWLLAKSERKPVLAVWEDLHWADASTVELLGLVVDQIPSVSMLSVLTCRPEFRQPWAPRSHLAQLALNRLPRAQVIEMARRVAGGKHLPDQVVEQVVTKTDGVPLFVEEMTKAILESGHLQESGSHFEVTGSLPAFAIPATLHDSLMARLDRLLTAKALAQYAAVIGRHFSYAVLRAVSELDEPTLERELRRLVDAELLYQRGLPPHATYTFKHALIRDAAYQSLLRRTRQQHHHRIAQVLEDQFPEIRVGEPEVLAYHYTEAGINDKAVKYWIEAGRHAVARSANVEAVGQLSKALEVLQTLPDTTGRAREELAVLMTLGPALIATKGYGTPDVHHTYVRARELCQQVGDAEQLFPALRGLWNRYLMQADHQMARELGEQLLELANRLQISANIVEAHRVLGTVYWNLGELSHAHEHLAQGIALYDPLQHRSLAFIYGADSGIVCNLYEGIVLWSLGYPNQARERMDRAFTLAKELAHGNTLAFVSVFAALLHRLCGDTQGARERAEAAIILGAEQGIPQWSAGATILLGSVFAAEGQHTAAMARIHEGLVAWRAASAEVLRPLWLALSAEALMAGGDPEAGMRALDEALALVSKTGERWYESELLRLRGEMLLALSGEAHTQAQAVFDRALEIAREQKAKSWELKIATSVSRLWQGQGRQDEAKELLAPVYRWFTEGFDTRDLQAARELLEALAR
jgi:class 3 adenylate cyclase/predicted ATPase